MEGVDQLFNSSPYHTYAHSQSHVYQPFFPSQSHHQPGPADPSRHPSPAPATIAATSSHGLFIQQPAAVPEPSNGQEQHTETPVDQIQDDAPIDEEPLYVNAKQYYRILKRRVARARLEEVHRLSRQRKPYLHESRHKHAMRRPRGPGGRFLTSEEIAAQKNAQAAADDPSASNSQDGDNDEDLDMTPHDQDSEMTLASPMDHNPTHITVDSQRNDEPAPPQIQSRPTIQPLLQPRPQIHIQTMQPLQKHEHQMTHALQPQSAPQHLAVQSPFDSHVPMPHSAGTLDLLSAPYMPPSHPTTPTAISPHSAMSEVISAPERVQHDHGSHAHHAHARAHDHQRHISSTATSATAGTTQSSPTTTAPGNNLNNVRTFAAMQMHHVPHPHAHARHHHSYLNRAEQLYANPGAINLRFNNSEHSRQ